MANKSSFVEQRQTQLLDNQTEIVNKLHKQMMDRIISTINHSVKTSSFIDAFMVFTNQNIEDLSYLTYSGHRQLDSLLNNSLKYLGFKKKHICILFDYKPENHWKIIVSAHEDLKLYTRRIMGL